MLIDNEDKREFYIAETIKNYWSKRELERPINSSLFAELNRELEFLEQKK
ncbi:MAG: hypothetical protein IE889_02885 [Campylobacterales bacterium]|nr:hypothetical protein [Campylobacterales bacterium]